MKRILIYGPYAEEYSLAKVNREFAKALAEVSLQAGQDVEIRLGASSEAISRQASTEDITKYPYLKELALPAYDPNQEWDLIIYNNFPKDPNALHGLRKLKAKVKAAFLAWEEDRFPKRWVDEYNQELQLVIAAGTHTQRVLKRSGVKTPIIIVPNALADSFFTHSQANAGPSGLIKTTKGFKFFHNSSGMERKGARELLAAYTSTFTAADDVCLVIKSFPNANNLFKTELERYSGQPNCPAVELIETDNLTEAEIIRLYQSCDAYISPSKAEGFNIPVLEAMLLKLPVVTTAWSGQMDFANDNNAYLVDYSLQPAQSHLDNPGAYWAQVSVADLGKKLRLVYTEHGSNRQAQLLANAYETARIYTWENSAKTFLRVLPDIFALPDTKHYRLGVISTYNTICGIAEYSSFLYESISHLVADLKFIANQDATGRVQVDGENILRLWEYGETDFATVFDWLDREKLAKGEFPLNLVHIQYSEGFYTLDALSKLINGLTDRSLPVILTAHAFQVEGVDMKEITQALAKCAQIHVLNQQDQDYLKSLGLNNTVHLPHGNITFPIQSSERLRKKLGIKPQQLPIIGNHGFMSEGKGIIETLKAIAMLKEQFPNLLYLAINAVNPRNMTSQALADEFNQLVKELDLQDNVIHLADFLDKSEIILLLAACDINVFAYPEAKQTASGAVRLAMAAGRPILATKSFQLADLKDIAFLIDSNDPTRIAQGLTDLWQDPAKLYSYQLKCLSQKDLNSWDIISLRYLGLLASLSPEN